MFPISVTVVSTAYARGRQLLNEQVVSMTTVVPGRTDVTATFPAGTKLDKVFGLLGERYSFVGMSKDTATKSGSVTVSRRYAYTGTGVGNGHHEGA